ncbi:MAG TPA: precorrin-2 C(20)-methyltransferase, partial [Solirubrobacteraceae bacterium]|nr:precorrin-2 C(20)-methyltransferase [Solirubrobacteraceae bacterium]
MTARAAGRLFGVGVGPGDPELVTVKAQRVLGGCDVVAYPAKRRGSSIARAAAAPWLAAGCEELALVYPVTTGEADHPAGYEGALRDFYDESAARIAALLDGGRDVAVLCEGDPFFYGSYMYLHERLADRYATQVVPGVTAVSAAAAAAGTPLAKRDDVLVVAPGTLPADVLAAHLRDADAAVVMKLGRRFDSVVAAASIAGVAERAVYVERASCERARVAALDEVDGEVPYMSLVLVPTARDRRAPGTERGAARRGGARRRRRRRVGLDLDARRRHAH